MAITQTDVKIAVFTGFIFGIATLFISQMTKTVRRNSNG